MNRHSIRKASVCGPKALEALPPNPQSISGKIKGARLVLAAPFAYHRLTEFEEI